MKKQEVIDFPPVFTIHLFGRYFATLSIMPWVFALVLAFFAVAYVFTWIILRNPVETFQVVLVPVILGSLLLLPFVVAGIFMIRWHGKRRMEMDEQGITLVLPGEKSVYVPWEYLLAVELRFRAPKLVVCTLVSRALRFNFSTLEINLHQRVAMRDVFEKGFDLDKMRHLLYYLHRQNPNLVWKTTPEFKEQFKVFYPPYDLEKLK